MTYDDSTEAGPSRDRSPSFPFISLPRAIERARQMHEAHRREAARLVVVGETWGYTPKSSGLLQTVAALKQYGLIEDVGRGEDRRIQLSDLGRRIVLDARDTERRTAIREAALRPRLVAEYAEKWGSDRPSDGHCLSELQLDRGFNPAAAKVFLRVLDETLAFAGLSTGDSFAIEFNQSNPGEPQSMKPAAPDPGSARNVPTVFQGLGAPPLHAPSPPPLFSMVPFPKEAPLEHRFNIMMSSRSISVVVTAYSREEVERLIKILEANKEMLPKEEPTAPISNPSSD